MATNKTEELKRVKDFKRDLKKMLKKYKAYIVVNMKAQNIPLKDLEIVVGFDDIDTELVSTIMIDENVEFEEII